MADQQPLLNPSEDVSSEDDGIISKHNNQDTTVGILDVVSVFQREKILINLSQFICSFASPIVSIIF